MVALAALVAASSLVIGCKDCNDKPAVNAVDAAPATPSAAPASSSAAIADDAMAPDGSATANADDRGRRGAQRGPNAMLFQAAREAGWFGCLDGLVERLESARP